MARRAERRGFGSIRKLPSGRYQARYTGPDQSTVAAPTTFTAKIDAEAWLLAERKHVEEPETWLPPAARREAARRAAEAARKPTFEAYSDAWLKSRKVKGRPLQPSTARGYRVWLNKYLNPAFGDLPLDKITPALVIQWHSSMDQDKAKTLRESYALGSAILRTAVAADGPLAGHVNPFAIDGAGSIGAVSDKREELVEDAEMPVILSTIRDEWRALVWLALGCGLRFGEATALRRTRDFDLKATPPVVKVRHAIGTEGGGRQYEKPPKSRAGVRDQRVPDAVLTPLKLHLRTYVTGRDGLLFPAPGGRLADVIPLPRVRRRLARRARGTQAAEPQLPRPARHRRHEDGPRRRERRRDPDIPRRQHADRGHALHPRRSEPHGRLDDHSFREPGDTRNQRLTVLGTVAVDNLRRRSVSASAAGQHA